MLAAGIKLALRPPPHRASIRTIAVTSSKGGIGKTTIATNLSLALAKTGCRTLLLDTDLGMRKVDILLGIHPDVTLLDVINGQRRLREIVFCGPGDLKVIPATRDRRDPLGLDSNTCVGLIRALSDIGDDIDCLLVNTASDQSESMATFCRASHNVLIITGEEPASLRDNAALVRQLHTQQRITRFHLLVNRVKGEHAARQAYLAFNRSLDDLHEVTVFYAGFVPQDAALRQAAIQQQPLLESFPKCRAAMAIRNLAARIVHWPLVGIAGGHMQFFVERLIKENNVEMEVM